MMPEIDGMEMLRSVKAAGHASEVVIITGHSTIESAVEAMKQGAADYLSKPFSPAQLKMVVGKGGRAIGPDPGEPRCCGSSWSRTRDSRGSSAKAAPMERVFSHDPRVAPTDGTVLITGESGTGKEMVVRAIHRLSRRKPDPLLACDCTRAGPHAAGKRAVRPRQGLVLRGDRHEAGAVRGGPPRHALPRRSGQPQHGNPGQAAPRAGDQEGPQGRRHGRARIDIRLVAATNRDLGEMVAEGEFREDLYYRLNVVPIHLPAAARATGRHPAAGHRFLKRFCRQGRRRRQRLLARGDGPAGKLLLAGQRPRTAQHRRADRHPLRLRPRGAAAPAPGNPRDYQAGRPSPNSPSRGRNSRASNRKSASRPPAKSSTTTSSRSSTGPGATFRRRPATSACGGPTFTPSCGSTAFAARRRTDCTEGAFDRGVQDDSYELDAVAHNRLIFRQLPGDPESAGIATRLTTAGAVRPPLLHNSSKRETGCHQVLRVELRFRCLARKAS